MNARFAVLMLLTVVAAGCAPEVGSPKWCEQLKARDKGDWTVNETRDYAKYCVLGLEPKP